MLNAIGLQGIGVRRFVDEKLPELRARRATVIVNVCGTTIDEYVEVSRILSDAEGVAAIELNISCPNIKEGGIQFGCSLTGTFDVVSAVRQGDAAAGHPKLTPNVTDVASFARAAEDAGADAVSLVNTFLAMVIDVETRRPKISNVRRRPERAGDPADRRAHGVRVPAAGEDSDHRHGRHRRRARRARVHDRRRDRRPGRHRELRGSVHLAEAARRHRGLHASGTRSRGSRIWSAPCGPTSTQGMQRVHGSAAGGAGRGHHRRGARARRTAARRWSADSRSAAGCSPATGRHSSRSWRRAAIACFST